MGSVALDVAKRILPEENLRYLIVARRREDVVNILEDPSDVPSWFWREGHRDQAERGTQISTEAKELWLYWEWMHRESPIAVKDVFNPCSNWSENLPCIAAAQEKDRVTPKLDGIRDIDFERTGGNLEGKELAGGNSFRVKSPVKLIPIDECDEEEEEE